METTSRALPQQASHMPTKHNTSQTEKHPSSTLLRIGFCLLRISAKKPVRNTHKGRHECRAHFCRTLVTHLDWNQMLRLRQLFLQRAADRGRLGTPDHSPGIVLVFERLLCELCATISLVAAPHVEVVGLEARLNRKHAIYAPLCQVHVSRYSKRVRYC